jgi:hypothetical protein
MGLELEKEVAGVGDEQENTSSPGGAVFSTFSILTKD